MCNFCFLSVFLGCFLLQLSPSVLWYCWLGLLTCKNRFPYNLYCVGGDVKHCTIQSESEHPRLTNREIIFEAFQPMWSRYHNVTDRQIAVASRGNTDWRLYYTQAYTERWPTMSQKHAHSAYGYVCKLIIIGEFDGWLGLICAEARLTRFYSRLHVFEFIVFA